MLIFQNMSNHPTSSAQYLEIKIFQQLRCHNHINNFATELNNASIMLYKVRQFANEIVI